MKNLGVRHGGVADQARRSFSTPGYGCRKAPVWPPSPALRARGCGSRLDTWSMSLRTH